MGEKAPAKYNVQLTVNGIWPKYEKEEEEERNKEQTDRQTGRQRVTTGG